MDLSEYIAEAKVMGASIAIALGLIVPYVVIDLFGDYWMSFVWTVIIITLAAESFAKDPYFPRYGRKNRQ